MKSLYEALFKFGEVASGIFPIFIIPCVFALAVYLTVNFSESERDAAIEEILFFGLLGATASYVNYLSAGTFLDNIVPQLIVISTFIFQLLGLSVKAMDTPLSSRRVLIAASSGVVSFIFAARYIELAFGNSTQG